MANARRPLDRSDEPAAKRSRFPGEAIAAGPVGDSESSSEGSMSLPGEHEEIVSRYRIALSELTFNSKPIITNLSIIAGDNLHAAGAIAATICANILEVPSEQKLSSLYLLDSIVKNIGQDYIYYFAAKLPEVFCKAYRQVDSSIHSGMRHLFATWKGVFPPWPLQAIEDELGFPSAGSGSSAASTIIPNSQSQGRFHPIHVNPKYLEAREQFQQSSRNLQRPQRDGFQEKNIDRSPGNYVCGSDLPRHSEQSFVKHADGGISGSSRPLSWSWKKSDKEDCMWDDDISRSSDYSTLNNSRTFSWTPANHEALGHENSLFKPGTPRDSHCSIDGEGSTYSWSTEHRDQGPSGQTESLSAFEPHSDVFSHSSSNRIISLHSEGSPNYFNEYSAIASYQTMTSLQAQTKSSCTGISNQHSMNAITPPQQSLVHQYPPLSSLASYSHNHQALHNLVDLTRLSSRCLPHQESSKAQHSGSSNMNLHSISVVQPSLPRHTSSDSRGTSRSTQTLPSYSNPLALTSLPHVKVEEPLLSHCPPASSVIGSTSDVINAVYSPVSSLLSSLVAKGLVTASKTESGDKEALLGFEFKPDIIRQLHPCVIAELLADLPHKCHICGLQVRDPKRLQRHLDWHELRVNSSNEVSRRWYATSTDWIAGKAGLTLVYRPSSVQTSSKMVEKNAQMVPADEAQCVCVLCGEIFEDIYCHERDEWMFNGACYMTVPASGDKPGTSSRGSRNLIVHAICKLKIQVQDLGLAGRV